MEFNEVVNRVPNVRVCDIIQLFLLGYDDKIYLNLKFTLPSAQGWVPQYLLKDERIIHDAWQPFYEFKVHCIEEECTEDTGLGCVTLVI